MFRRNLLLTLLLVSCASALQAQQQTPAPSAQSPTPAQSPSQKKTPTQCLIKETSQNGTPKAAKARTSVYPVVQRLNGFDILAIMKSRGRDVKVVDKNFLFNVEIHTNIVAGFTLVDGDTIVTRLPQAELVYTYKETIAGQSQTPTPKSGAQGTVTATVNVIAPVPSNTTQPKVASTIPSGQGGITAATSPMQSPRAITGVSTLGQLYTTSPRIFPPMVTPQNITVYLEKDCGFDAKFLGVDNLTGLSLLQVEGLNQTPLPIADTAKLSVNQRVQLFAPLSAEQQAVAQVKANLLSMKVKTIVGQLKVIEKSSATGEIRRMTVSAENLTPALIGGVVMNEQNEAIGVIESLTPAGEARVTPIANVKKAIERVRAAQLAHAPQPWLGVKGEFVGFAPLEKLMGFGWGQPQASQLLTQNRGVLVTSVQPGTPAASSQLKPGDVILGVNKNEIKNQDDFTQALKNIGSNKDANFELLRPQSNATETITTRLGETPDPKARMWNLERRAFGMRTNNLFLTIGMETVLMEDPQTNKPRKSYSTVVWGVYPESAAERAGLQSGDVVETINGEPANTFNRATAVRGEVTLTVVRKNQTLVFKINPFEDTKR